jgi:hypothetical protein
MREGAALIAPSFGVSTTNQSESFNAQAASTRGMRSIPISAAVMSCFETAGTTLSRELEKAKQPVVLAFSGVSRDLMPGIFANRLKHAMDRAGTHPARVHATASQHQFKVESTSGSVVDFHIVDMRQTG